MCNFVNGHAHQTAQKQALKGLIALLYTLGKGSHRMLGKIFGVSNGTIRNWINEASNGLAEQEVSEEITEIEFDERLSFAQYRHYIVKKSENCGLSRQMND